MKMKQLLRYTTSLLRTALLFETILFVNSQIQAQTAEQWAEMPDAFETVDPTTVDWSQEPYFYIQFFEGNVHSFLGEYGLSEVMRSKDYIPFSKSIQWTLIPTGTDGEYYLKSLNGNYVRQWPTNTAYCGASPIIDDNRYKFTLTKLSDGYYELVRGSYCLGRENGYEWGRIRPGFDHNSPRARLRFARLKSNVAHIIYYRGEGHYTSNALDNPSDETRHYLTYSGTAESSLGTNWWWSNVSSRQSIIPKDKSLWTLPTVAAYHLDGLWTLEKADVEGDFFIKKYGTSQYLNEDQHNDVYGSELGAKDATKGTYTLESPNTNRYTRIQNVKYVEDQLTADMFKTWNGYGADATSTGTANVDFNVGNNATIYAEGLVAGTWSVDYLTYADLRNYSKMTINGSPEMQLRVLLSRQVDNNGSFIEKDVTIGSDGKALIDLTDMEHNIGLATVKMTYVDANDPTQSFADTNDGINRGNPAKSGYNKISNGNVDLAKTEWGVNNITYLQVDARGFSGNISKVTLKAKVSGSIDNKRNTTWGVGYNNSEWSSNLTWNNADKSITQVGEEKSTTFSFSYGSNEWSSTFLDVEFDITDAFTNDADRIVTILVYETEPGGGFFKDPIVEVEYANNLNIDYAHLNAIKTRNGSPAGTINSISLAKVSDQNTRYLHHAHGDGWQVMQWSNESTSGNDWWYAGFLPVEVPESKKDDYYGVLLKVKKTDNRIKLIGQTNNPSITPLDGSSLDNLYGATFTPTADLTNVFQIKNMSTSCYEKIVVKFGSAVPSGWYIHAYGEQSEYYSLEGRTEYEIILDPTKKVDDFTIFNWFGVRSSITISECYFTPANPSCQLAEMLNYEGGTDAYSEEPGIRKLWHLEQVDDYKQFRLRAPDGNYFQDDGVMTSDVNSAMIFTNTSLLEKFDLKWFYIDPAVKEIPVDKKVTHRMSYLKDYAYQYRELELDRQGLATDVQSDWWNYDMGTQKVNHFEITHYVERNKTITVEFPTILNNSSDHIYYQRWYHYNDETCNNTAYPDGTDINGLKSHVSLDVSNDVQYFLYNNGIVTGEKLKWDGIEQGSFVRHANRNFKYTNSDGKNFTVAADVSRYSDLAYKENGDLEEPSLTMRYIYYMKDAKVMAKKLTACTEGSGKWLEARTFHFPAKQIHYEAKKKAGYRGEFIGLQHVFSDYWVFSSGNPDDTDDSHLVSAVIGNTSGRIIVEIVDDTNNPTLIRKGGYVDDANYDRYGFADWSNDNDYKGFYLYDMMDNKNQYGDSRFIVFRYPVSGQVNVPTDPNVEQKAYINVYLKDEGNNRRYQLAQFTIIFDPGTVTLPYTSVNASDYVKADDNNTIETYKNRDPKKLVERAGKPIAKITFDYPYPTDEPSVHTYHYPDNSDTRHAQYNYNGGFIANSSPVPLTFDKTNYAFDGDNANWGSYAMVGGKSTIYGKWQKAWPANDATHGYGVEPDKGFKSAFLYIDASEQPGNICSAPFVGDFCTGDKLMFSGWISGSNAAGESDNRCPGGVTLTVKGEHNLHNPDGTIMYDEKGNPKKETVTLYRFCPGQIYELDDGEVDGVSFGIAETDRDKHNVVWQQFYFEFEVGEKYDRHWIEVNNNCVSSKGGDFMLDNIEVYCIVPEVIPGINTPLCVSVNDQGDVVTDMRLLKLSMDFNKLSSSAANNEQGFVFLDKEKFLSTFRTELRKLSSEEKSALRLSAFNFNTISLDALADAIEDGEFQAITGSNAAYQAAFNAAILGEKKTWYSKNPSVNYPNASVMYFQWNRNFDAMPTYSFANAVNKTAAVYGEVVDGEKFVVMNGNFPLLNWNTNTDYYIITSSTQITELTPVFDVFNLCSECTKASVFRIEPPYSILGLDKSEDTNDYVVCEGKIPTLLVNLKGYDLEGKEVDMKDLNFDWWLGNKSASTSDERMATIENYHKQVSGDGIRLDKALPTLRWYYPEVNSLDGLIAKKEDPNPELTLSMIQYLQDLVEAGELVLHQKSISIPAKKADENDDPYFYLVACPIHDDNFNQALNPQDNEYVAYYCDEPQGLRIKVGEKAPTLQTGFVPGEHGFETYNYAFPEGTNPVLSIRLAKEAQFETVKNNNVEASNGAVSTTVNYLWLPIRDARTQTATGIIKKTKDDNIYLASTNDPVEDKEIYKEMSKNGVLPVVGRIVQLNAINTKDNSEGAPANAAPVNVNLQNDNNRLCIYFTENFEVREGYNYTLSLPFQEEGDVNSCDGTMLINLKIVPDYEVWTGGAGNTDWNNDENWRRADGNTNTGDQNNTNERNSDELLRKIGATASVNSPLHDYMTNKDNYRSKKDRLFRKGFAPLYCTHILMKSDEWGDAPVLYDALDYKSEDAEHKLINQPFPNLRDTSTPILKFDMQARRYDMWKETYGVVSDRGSSDRPNDLIAEMYQINSCDEIAFQPGTELRNAHLLNYNNAWVEYQLDNKRWYLLGSPLQGTISGEWYAPTGSAKQETTYFDPVAFSQKYVKVTNIKSGDNPSTLGWYKLSGNDYVEATETEVVSNTVYFYKSFNYNYDRYSPAIYQRSWDKAKAVLYEVGANYSNDDDNVIDGQTQSPNLGTASQGQWSGTDWNQTGADDYLDRLGYKPMGGKKANVAIKGIWSNTYNDAQVDYAMGGFSVMVMNHLKNNDTSGDKSIIRLPKEDTMFDYYTFSETNADNGRTDTYLVDHNNEQGVQSNKSRALNRGRLKTDNLLPEPTSGMTYTTPRKIEAVASIYGDRRTYTRVPTTQTSLQEMNTINFSFTETIPTGATPTLGYFLVENPFPCGLDMTKFFESNTGVLETKYWLLTTAAEGQDPRQQLVQQAPDGEWIPSDGSSDFSAADAVIAPGQGFFVQAKSAGQAATITYTKDMQAKTRYGEKDNEHGTSYTYVIGQAQEMEQVYLDDDGDPETPALPQFISVDLNGNGEYGEEGIVIDGKTVDEKEPVMAPKYEKNEDGSYKLDDNNNKIPVLKDIYETVTVYSYKQKTGDGYQYPLKARTRGGEANLLGLVITAQRGDSQSSALVMQREGASNDFLPEEDTEVFINSDLEYVPTVYTLCGRLATTINSIHDFRCLPLGVESNSNAPCTLTFWGVEMLGDSISLYDAVEQKLMPLASGAKVVVSGQTQNRYYLVRSLDQKEAAEETHLQIFAKGLVATVIASTAEPITNVRCFDTAGRLVYSASPQMAEYSFNLPAAGIYIIEAQTEADHKTKKVMTK